jgi:hypothetical protein
MLAVTLGVLTEIFVVFLSLFRQILAWYLD